MRSADTWNGLERSSRPWSNVEVELRLVPDKSEQIEFVPPNPSLHWPSLFY